MNKTFLALVVIFTFVVGCTIPSNDYKSAVAKTAPETTSVTIDQNDKNDQVYINNIDEKVFSFGNPSGKQVLIVMGMDVYIHRIVNLLGEASPFSTVPIKQRLINHANAQTVIDGNLNSYQWKDITFSAENSFFTVIITNKEENIFSYIEKYPTDGKKFDYMVFTYHGNPDGVDSEFQARYLAREDILNEIDNFSIVQGRFSPDCKAIMFSCSVLSDSVTIPFAVFMQAATGIKDFSASSNDVGEEEFPDFTYKEHGKFARVSTTSIEKLKAMAIVYKQHVSSEKIVGTNYYGSAYWYYKVTVTIPSSAIASYAGEYDSSTSLYDIYDYIDGVEVVTEYCVGSKGEIIVVVTQDPWGDNPTQTKKVIDSSYSELLKFVFDVHYYEDVTIKYN